MCVVQWKQKNLQLPPKRVIACNYCSLFNDKHSIRASRCVDLLFIYRSIRNCPELNKGVACDHLNF